MNRHLSLRLPHFGSSWVPAPPSPKFPWENSHRKNADELATYSSSDALSWKERTEEREEGWGKLLGKSDLYPRVIQKWFEREDWTPIPLFLAGDGDPYSRHRPELPWIRPLLKTCLAYRHPVQVLSGSLGLTKDGDLWEELGKAGLGRLFVYIPSLDENHRLHREPSSDGYRSRLQILDSMARKDIPVGVFMGPLTNESSLEERRILIRAAKDHGASWAKWGPSPWDPSHSRSGDQRSGNRDACGKIALVPDPRPWQMDAFRRPKGQQLPLF